VEAAIHCSGQAMVRDRDTTEDVKMCAKRFSRETGKMPTFKKN